jgi:hypothetical protein
MQYYYRFILTILTLSISFADLASSQNKSNNPSFGVVYSSDRDIQQAKWETDQLAGRLSQYQNQAKLFKRRNWYVSVIVFPRQSDAKESLSIIENTYSRGSFVVNLQEWCRPDWRKNTGVKLGVSYYDCRRGEIILGRTGAIIINKFSTIKDAKSDLEKLKKNTFQRQQHNLTIFKRGDSYFTAVINYANKEEASQNLRGGYAVDINQFCPQPGELSKDDYIECK